MERHQRLYGRERYNPLCTLQRLAVCRMEGRVVSVGASRAAGGPAASRYEQVLAQDVLDSRSALCGAGGRGRPRKTWGVREVKDNSRSPSSTARTSVLLLPLGMGAAAW